MKNMRWLPVLATVLFASGCGVILGMFLLTMFVDTDVEASKNDLPTAQIPRVVQASELMDKHSIEKDAVTSAIKHTIDFPNKKWYFVQAGVFHTPEYAYPIEQQLKSKGFAFQMYDMSPSRLMLAGFCNVDHVNDIIKQWSSLQIDLYAKEMEIAMQPVPLYLTEELSSEGDKLAEKVLAFYEQLAQSSYQLLKGDSEDLQILQSKKTELLALIDRLLTIDENKEQRYLLSIKELLEASEPIVNGDKQLGRHLQELLLSLLANSEVKEVK